jgi:hypothetical protein
MLNDPTTQKVLNMIEQHLTQTWKEANDEAAREQLWYTLKGHQRFINTLEVLRDNSNLDATLEERATNA